LLHPTWCPPFIVCARATFSPFSALPHSGDTIYCLSTLLRKHVFKNICRPFLQSYTPGVPPPDPERTFSSNGSEPPFFRGGGEGGAN